MLISRKQFFARPQKAFPQISPDGNHVAYLAYQENQANVCVLSVDETETAEIVFASPTPGLHFQWTHSSQHILIFQPSITENKTSLQLVNIKTKEQRSLCEQFNGGIHLLDQSAITPEQFLIGNNGRDPRWFDIYRVNYVSNEAELVFENNRFSGFLASDLQLQLAVSDNNDGSNEYFTCDASLQWHSLFSVDKEDAQTTIPLCVDRKNRKAYLKDTRHHDTSVLTMMDMATGESNMLACNDKADVDECLINMNTYTVDAVCFNPAQKQWQVINNDIKNDFDELTTSRLGELSIINQDSHGNKWIVAYANADKPNEYYIYSRTGKQLTRLFSNIPEFESLSLKKMQHIYSRSRDDLELLSYYTLPDTSEHKKKPMPLVVLIHGGPWARDKWGYNPWHQWLANRGYAVLSVNYRGSSGFGKRFMNAGNREWGGHMVDDIHDAVAAFKATESIDAQRIAVMGTSYGGYAALMLASRYADNYQCAIDVFGPTDLVKMIESIPPQWQSQREMFIERIGNPDTEAGRALLMEQSPIRYADQFGLPALIVEGFHDPRVDRNGIRDYVSALKEHHSAPLIHLSFPDEGHDLSKEANRLAFCAIAEQFLKAHLYGQCEGMEDGLLSHVEVLSGQEYISDA